MGTSCKKGVELNTRAKKVRSKVRALGRGEAAMEMKRIVMAGRMLVFRKSLAVRMQLNLLMASARAGEGPEIG